MGEIINNPANYDIRIINMFLFVKNISTIEMHTRLKLVKVYGPDVISGNKQTNIHDKECNGYLTVITDGLLQNPNEKKSMKIDNL